MGIAPDVPRDVAEPGGEGTAPLERAFERFLVALRRARGRVPAGSDGRLTLAQLHLMTALDAQPGRTVRELAGSAGVTQPTITRAIDALQRQGLVTRTASPEDRRCVLIELTSDGHDLLRTERARIDARRHELLAQLSPEERVQAERLLVRLADLVERL